MGERVLLCNTQQKLLPWGSMRARHRERGEYRTERGVHGPASRGKLVGGRHLLEAEEETLRQQPGEEREGRGQWWEGTPGVGAGSRGLLVHHRDEGACRGEHGVGINWKHHEGRPTRSAKHQNNHFVSRMKKKEKQEIRRVNMKEYLKMKWICRHNLHLPDVAHWGHEMRFLIACCGYRGSGDNCWVSLGCNTVPCRRRPNSSSRGRHFSFLFDFT